MKSNVSHPSEIWHNRSDRLCQIKRVALTGGIACGKSLVAKYLNEFGIETIDADDIVHELVPEDERRRLAKIVFNDPAARKALEARLHPLVRARIDAFLAASHPIPGAEREGRACRDRGEEEKGCVPCLSPDAQETPLRVAVATSATLPDSNIPLLHSSTPPLRLAVIPLLFEVQWDADFDIICCVASERENQIRRMTTTRGYTREEAEARLAAQLPVEEKAAKSHYVIRNDGTADELREEVARFVAFLGERTA